MPAMESLEAELAIKTNLVEALNAENEQLRTLLQRHADAADARLSGDLPPGDMRRESNIHELQSVITHMRSQLYENASDRDSDSATIDKLQQENALLRAIQAEATDEMAAMKSKVSILEEELKSTTEKYEEERLTVATLRNGMEESKRAISIMKDQLDRRNSVTHAPSGLDVVRRGSIDNNLRKVSVAGSNVSDARRGSLNYLTGLGLTNKRLNHFDPSRATTSAEEASFNPRASLPVSAAANRSDGAGEDASDSPSSIRRRASLPIGNNLMFTANSPLSTAQRAISTAEAGPASPRFASTSRRSSLTARRGSLDPSNSVQRRNSNLAHTLSRLCPGEGDVDEDQDLPLARRGSGKIQEEEDDGNLTQLPTPKRRGSINIHDSRRRSSVHLGGGLSRRGSEKLPSLLEGTPGHIGDGLPSLPSTVFEEDTDNQSVMSSVLSRATSFPPNERNGVIQALSAEAAMEISNLKEALAELKMQLFEAEESREASEAVARALREFIASSASNEPEQIKLPPLPTESTASMEAQAEQEAEEKKKGQQQQEKRSSRWGMPKLLPSLSYSSIRRDASSSIVDHLPAIVSKAPSSPIPQQQLPAPPAAVRLSNPSIKDGSQTLLLPEWRKTATLRSSVASGMSDSTSSVAPSPILSSGVPGFTSSFSGFSFAAYQARTMEEVDEPASPMGSRDSPTFEAANPLEAYSSESEAESMPATPSDTTFGDRIESNSATFEEEQKKGHSRNASDMTMTPRAGSLQTF